MSSELSSSFENALAALVSQGVGLVGLTSDNVTTGFTDETRELPSFACIVSDNERIGPRSQTRKLTGSIQVNSSTTDKYGAQLAQDRHSDLVECVIESIDVVDIKSQLTGAAGGAFHVYSFELGNQSRITDGIQQIQTTIPFTACAVYTPVHQYVETSGSDSAFIGQHFVYGGLDIFPFRGLSSNRIGFVNGALDDVTVSSGASVEFVNNSIGLDCGSLSGTIVFSCGTECSSGSIALESGAVFDVVVPGAEGNHTESATGSAAFNDGELDTVIVLGGTDSNAVSNQIGLESGELAQA